MFKYITNCSKHGVSPSKGGKEYSECNWISTDDDKDKLTNELYWLIHTWINSTNDILKYWYWEKCLQFGSCSDHCNN